jgi:uncharacterized protein (DUF2267 family)
LHPARQPERSRTLDAFLARVDEGPKGIPPVNARDATQAVLRTLSRHADPGRMAKVINVLPEDVRKLWLDAMGTGSPPVSKSDTGNAGQ